MIDLAIDGRSFVIGACCMALCMVLSIGLWRLYQAHRADKIKAQNRKEIEARWEAMRAARYITDYDEVAQAAIAGLENEWQEKMNNL